MAHLEAALAPVDNIGRTLNEQVLGGLQKVYVLENPKKSLC